MKTKSRTKSTPLLAMTFSRSHALRVEAGEEALKIARNLALYRHAIRAALDHRPKTQAGVERQFDRLEAAIAKAEGRS